MEREGIREMTTASECVERGAMWLDEYRPGWWERIDLDRLDISSGINCILGQEWESEHGEDYSSYRLAIEAWGLDDAEVGKADRARLGFTTDWREFPEMDSDDLTDAWRSYIAERRGQAT